MDKEVLPKTYSKIDKLGWDFFIPRKVSQEEEAFMKKVLIYLFDEYKVGVDPRNLKGLFYSTGASNIPEDVRGDHSLDELSKIHCYSNVFYCFKHYRPTSLTVAPPEPARLGSLRDPTLTDELRSSATCVASGLRPEGTEGPTLTEKEEDITIPEWLKKGVKHFIDEHTKGLESLRR